MRCSMQTMLNCVQSERDKVKGICQHPWAGMHVRIHRHQRPIPGGKLPASNQWRVATSNNGSGRITFVKGLVIPKAKPDSLKQQLLHPSLKLADPVLDPGRGNSAVH